MKQDTRSERMARYHQLLRAQEPWERLRSAVALSAAVRSLAEAGLRQRNPAASDEEIRVRLAVRLYGRACAQRLFRSVPADAV